MSAYPTIDALRAGLGAKAATDAAYAAKMLHKVPEAPVVDRAGFLLDLCRGKRVLEFGASGPMHEKIKAVASVYQGVDRDAGPQVVAFDLDDVSLDLPDTVFTLDDEAPPDVIVCGEVLEHLGNPQWFLTRLRQQYAGVTTVVTVPNAFSEAARAHMARGIENVNPDHVSWFSYKTLYTLLGRAGYTKNTFAWYGGKPYVAEGLIVVME